MTIDIETTAIETIARSVASSPRQSAMAAALARIAGNTLARLRGHEDAFKLHASLARHHHEQMGKGRR